MLELFYQHETNLLELFYPHETNMLELCKIGKTCQSYHQQLTPESRHSSSIFYKN